MKQKLFCLTITLLFVVVISPIVFCTYAQVTTVPYDCSFESLTENSAWQLNVGPAGNNAKNKWYVSSAEQYTGTQSLIISNDLGVSASYSHQSSAMVTYREFTLPSGTYDLSFVWRAGGEAGKDGLYVCWVPASTITNSSLMGAPPFVKNTALTFNSRTILQGSTEWSVENTTIVSQGQAMKLVFVWINDAAGGINPSVCIDNIQVASTNCSKPSNVRVVNVNGVDANVSWTGNASGYDVQYRAYGNAITTTISGINANNYVIKNLPKGLYDFWVRSHCGIDTSMWVSFNNVLIYSASVQCIDFANFNSQSVFCTTGIFDNPYQTRACVDNGYASKESRHTLHFKPGETDLRTEGRLKTIPDGEVASVRLGNWESGSEAESITYTLALDAASELILLLKYAVILEAPGHGQDPRFQLEVLDMSGNSLDAQCSGADFTANINRPGWKVANPPGFNPVSWKDWTTIGLNLTPYAGTTVQIRLTTYDCGKSGHFGYAYFTLGCAEAKISGVSCGDIVTTSVSAPDGFNYRWYKPLDPLTIVSTSKDLNVDASDTATYNCDVVFTENSNCKFTLTASLLPRSPLARFTPKWDPDTCKNYVYFNNTSRVVTARGTTTEKCESYYWDFGNGVTSREESPRIKFPEEGGTFNIQLVTGISSNMCMDTFQLELNVPSVKVVNDTLRRTICNGQRVIFNGEMYNKTGLYKFSGKSVAGCDSILVLDLKVINKIEIYIYDTICSGEFYDLNGQLYRNTGTYKSTVKTEGGCDSVTTVNLFVKDKIIFDYTVNNAESGPNSGSIDISNVDATWTYTINGEENGSLTDLHKGVYIIIFRDKNGCESDPVEITVDEKCIKFDLTREITNICADEETFLIPFRILDGTLVDYSLKFDAKATATGFQDVVAQQVTDDGIVVIMPEDGKARPNNYKVDIILNDLTCGETVESCSFDIYYASSIMAQKWNDVIALHSEKYNGGYKFSKYKWFRNGLPLENESPILYLNGSNFVLNDIYHVELTRVDDNVTMLSCPMTPTDKPEDPKLYPTKTVADASQKIMLYDISGNGTVTWYDYLGRVYNKYNISDKDFELLTPSVKGFYLLEVVTDEGRSIYKVYIK